MNGTAWYDNPTITDGTYPYLRDVDKLIPNPDYVDKQQKHRMNKNINPQHYRTHPSGVECIIISREMGFCLGNAFKYLFRCGHKKSPLEDLQKALWYLEHTRTRRYDPWWLRFLHAGYLQSMDAPAVVCAVVAAENRYSGHMAAALGHVWAAHQCYGIYKHLDMAIRSVKVMVAMEKLRGEDAV